MTHTVNCYGIDPATITQAHADRVAAALGLAGAEQIGLPQWPVIRTGYLTITARPTNPEHPDIVTLPWSLVAGLGEAACQPIDTAPRDGRLIVLHFGQDVTTVGRWSPMAYDLPSAYPWQIVDRQTAADGSGDLFVNRCVDGPGGPSHWSPLPGYDRPGDAAIRDSRTPNEAAGDHGPDSDVARLRAVEPREMRRLRWLLAMQFAGPRLYRDDGEYCDSASGIDFRRDSVAEIERKMGVYRRLAAIDAERNANATPDARSPT